MELDSIERLRQAWYRLVGTTSDDDALTEQGESADDVVDYHLTRGIRAAQRFLISKGMAHRWRVRSAALSWSGSDDVNGGRYASLPSNFLRFAGRVPTHGAPMTGALVQANGDAWGEEISAEEDHLRGNAYYLKNDQVWLARGASPPSTLYLDYHYSHPALSSGTESFDFPLEAMPLVVAEAADDARSEPWYTGDDVRSAMIGAALTKAREEAKNIARQSRAPRRMRGRPMYGRRW